MTTPLQILAVLALIAGFIGLPGGLSLFDSFLHPVFATEAASAHEAGNPLQWVLLLVSMLIALAGIYTAYHMYVRNPAVPKRLVKQFGWLDNLLARKYYVDQGYDEAIVKPSKQLAGWLARVFESGVIDGIVNGLGVVTTGAGALLGRLQAGFVRGYAFSFLLGVAAILGYLVLR